MAVAVEMGKIQDILQVKLTDIASGLLLGCEGQGGD